MNYIWAPRGGAESGMELSSLPSEIADAVKNVVERVDLKEGLNVIGRMNIERNSKIGKVLAAVGAYKDHLPLVGKLSPKLFKKGGGAGLKNEILDALDFKIPLPNAKGEILLIDCRYSSRYDYLIDIRGYIKFINTLSGKCLQPKSYGVGAELVERTCSQLDYQWWNPQTYPGAWLIRNAQTGTCTRAIATNSLNKTVPVSMNDCKSSSVDAIAPVIDPNSGINFVLKYPNVIPPHQNVAYPGTPDVGICAMNGMNGPSWLPGTLTITPNVGGNCWVTLGGKEYKDKGGQQMYVNKMDGVEWRRPPVSGKFPPNAIPSGFHVGGGARLGEAIAYTCRTKAVRGPATVTRIGWKLDARTCQYTYYNRDVTTDFEVLTRQPSKAYKLDLTN